MNKSISSVFILKTFSLRDNDGTSRRGRSHAIHYQQRLQPRHQQDPFPDSPQGSILRKFELSDDVIATVVGGSATEIFGVVGMASKSAIRDNFQALLGKENYAKGVVVKSTDAGITVDVYTVMSYGVKISEVSKNIQERVKFNLENQLGIKTEAVNVYVQNIKVVGEN